MSYTLTEQYVIERVGERAEGIFWFIKESAVWLAVREGFLHSAQAEESLAELYLAVVYALEKGDDSKRSIHLAQQRLSMAAIERALIGLRRDRRLLKPLAELNGGPMAFEPPSEGFYTRRAGGAVSLFCETAEFAEFCRKHLTRNPKALRDFLVRACACEKRPPLISPSSKTPSRLLVRAAPLAADLSLVETLMGEVMGDYLCRVPREIWTHWPYSLDGTWALRLSGVRVALLDGVEPHEKFPQAALKRLLSGDPVEYRGRDRLLYPLSPPPGLVLCGPNIHPNRLKGWEITLREQAFSLPPLSRWDDPDHLPTDEEAGGE